MKILSVILKSIKENIRHLWLLILTISLTPFFVGFYWAVSESEKPSYDVLLVNQDIGVEYASKQYQYGDLIIEEIKKLDEDDLQFPMTIKIENNRTEAVKKLKDKKADALVIFPRDFSEKLQFLLTSKEEQSINIEFVGDLTSIKYMITAIWAAETFSEFIYTATNKKNPVKITETSLGISGKIDEFDLYVPGLLILSIIMLLLPASISMVNEVENKTIIRLKMSKVSALEFLTGISIVQLMIGFISIACALSVAIVLGFEYAGSLLQIFVITVLSSVSIIALSLILAAFTKTATEVLIVGNFPLFLLMFFTGVAIPIHPNELFTIAGYPITLQGLMSPTHAVNAMNKTMIMNMNFVDILPEITALLVLSAVYFVLGVWLFWRRHMRV
jgi:ABC-2 type transport system permease protein